MSVQTIKIVIAGALLLHGLGHGGALGVLISALAALASTGNVWKVRVSSSAYPFMESVTEP